MYILLYWWTPSQHANGCEISQVDRRLDILSFTVELLWSRYNDDEHSLITQRNVKEYTSFANPGNRFSSVVMLNQAKGHNRELPPPVDLRWGERGSVGKTWGECDIAVTRTSSWFTVCIFKGTVYSRNTSTNWARVVGQTGTKCSITENESIWWSSNFPFIFLKCISII